MLQFWFFFSGKALESQPEFRRAHWKDMFTGRMKTEIPPALINLTRLDFRKFIQYSANISTFFFQNYVRTSYWEICYFTKNNLQEID